MVESRIERSPDMRWNRLAAAAGLATVLLAFVELFGPSFPQTGDTATAVDAYFTAHRSWSLAAVVVQGLGDALWLVFLCGLAGLIRAAGAAVAASAALVGGALNVAISLTGLATVAALAFGIAGSGEPTLTKAFFDLAAMTLVLSNFLLALMAAAVAAAPTVRWFRLASGGAAFVFALGGAALARHGALSPDGTLQFATYGVELLWTLTASVVMLRAREEVAVMNLARAEAIPAG
jgi:hypothetical protein